MGLLEKLCHWGMCYEVSKAHARLSLPLSFPLFLSLVNLLNPAGFLTFYDLLDLHNLSCFLCLEDSMLPVASSQAQVSTECGLLRDASVRPR